MFEDFSAFGTQGRMVVEHLDKRHTQNSRAIEELGARIDTLQRTVDALAGSASTKVYGYEQSRLLRALRWLRLI
jgi:hypothetical protein